MFQNFLGKILVSLNELVLQTIEVPVEQGLRRQGLADAHRGAVRHNRHGKVGVNKHGVVVPDRRVRLEHEHGLGPRPIRGGRLHHVGVARLRGAFAKRSARAHRPMACRSASARVMFFTAYVVTLGSSSQTWTLFRARRLSSLASLTTRW